MTITQRPFGVTLIAVLMLLMGIFRTIGGIFLLFRNPYAEGGLESAIPPEVSALPNSSLFVGIVLLVIGLLGLLMSYGLFTLKGWARTLTIAVAFANLLGPLMKWITQNQRPGLDAVISFIFFALVFYYFSTTPVKRAFGQG